MHLVMISLALAIAITIRRSDILTQGTWQQRWERSLFCFLFPPLLLLVTACAVLYMGPGGQMLGFSAGWLSYGIAIAFLITILGLYLILGYQVWQTQHQLQQHPQIHLHHYPARLIDNQLLFSAQIGFWQPQLVIAQGLLDRLTPEQLNAVLTHEQAHSHYRDTFWFFWLGGLRRLTAWLPQTETLWQELLLLRELRADCWTAQQVDPLLLAETLLLVVSQPIAPRADFCAPFSCALPANRLAERIDALISEPNLCLSQPRPWLWSWVGLCLLPLMSVPLHH
ncbi:MAG: M56 family metallopeptidase [Desertifilum sp. SIO1I2]|nr:M56 family metallopeptidase [Desertifilum sp. SIO1I2]